MRLFAAFTVLICVPHGVLSAQTVRNTDMTDDTLFWKVIDSTTGLGSEPDKQLDALHAALGKLSLEQIERYESSRL